MEVIYIKVLIWIIGFNTNVTLNNNVKNEGTCLDCHKNVTELPTVHAAAESCENCHTSTGAAHPDASNKGFKMADVLPNLCYNCHESVEKSLFTHGAVKEKKKCVNCHSPHSSTQAKLLLTDQKTLCLTCHNKEYNTQNGKIRNIKQILGNAKVIHSPVESDGCTACHNPHDSGKPKLLTDVFPSGEYAVASKDSFALCFTCHDSELLLSEKTTTATGFRNGDKNLHFLHINGTKGRSCILCHNVHASVNDHLISDILYFGSKNLKQQYNHSESGGSCLNACHKEKFYTR